MTGTNRDMSGTCPGAACKGQPGVTSPFRGMSPLVPLPESDGKAGKMPAAARRAAFAAWQEAGEPWPLPEPMGAVLDHALDRCADRGRHDRRWTR